MSVANWKYVGISSTGGLGLEEGYILAWFGSEDKVTLSTRWEAGEGVFLFLKMKASDVDQLLLENKLREYFQEPVNAQVRFLWVENPTEPLGQWRSNSISVENKQLSRTAYLDVNNYAFSFAKGTTVSLQSNTFHFARANDNPQGFEFSAGYGLHKIYDIGPSLTLDMTGDLRGCLAFELDLKMVLNKEELSFGYPGLSQLDVSLRLFFRDPDFPESGDEFYLTSHRYPILDETHTLLTSPSDDPADTAPQVKDADHPLKNEIDTLLGGTSQWLQKAFNYYPHTISFSVTLDPLYPLAAQRTFFLFKKVPGLAAKTGLPSAYRTNLGYRVHLHPIAGESKLQMALRPARLTDKEGHTAPYYLVPAGDFHIQVPNYHLDVSLDPKADANIDCGISGVEYIKINGSSEATLTFVPRQAAYAPSHVSVSAMLRDFPIIYKAYTGEVLEKNTTDQDQPIVDKRDNLIEGETNDYLEVILRDYFPHEYSFTESQSVEYNALERVEELVTWLQNALIAGGGGNGTLSDTVTTSWVYIKQGEGAVYYAQPEQAILYKAEASSTDFLDFLEIPSVGLPVKGNDVPLAFPMLPYGDVDPHALTDLRLLEVSLINHFRRKKIQEISADTEHKTLLAPEDSSQGNHTGTTPQGLIATFSADYRTILRLELGRDTHEPIPRVIPLVNIEHGTPLKAALQSNQLFMVVSKSEALSENFRKELVDAIDDPVNNLDASTAMEIKEWIFELGTESWNPNDRNTLLIFKFHDKPLIELAASPELWSFPDFFNTNKYEASSTLLGLLQKAVEIGKQKDAPKESGKYEVLAQAATQANWTGILAFNVTVPPNGLPPELMALTAGINPDLFYAQYVGIELTRVTSNGTKLKPTGSSLFGLIDYADPTTPEADATGYNFHVASLSVVFENSRIKDFSAEILLVVEKLFGEAARLQNSRNNIISLIGVAEEHNGKTTYSFGFKGANRFKLSGNALEEVEIVKTQFVTDPIANLEAPVLDVVGRFIFWGRIRFAYHDQFDILSFGRAPGSESEEPDYLSFSNMQIVMEFELDTNSTEKPVSAFTFDPGQMAYDLTKSGWRKQSLYEKFPLIFRGFLIGKEDGSVQRGFMDVNTPLDPVVLGKDGVSWYGMTFSLNMESSEDVGAKAMIKANILVGWNVGEKGLYVGLSFPGSSGAERSLKILGLLKLVFKSIRFVAYPINTEWENGVKIDNLPPEREVGYLLNLKNIKLEFLTLSFPPVGKTEITLFGDPATETDREKRLVGWYASYVKK